MGKEATNETCIRASIRRATNTSPAACAMKPTATANSPAQRNINPLKT